MHYFPKQTTTKLFYRKWSYKVKCVCKGSWMIKRRGLQYALERCLQPSKMDSYRTDIDPAKLKNFIEDVEKFLDKDIFVRSEGSIFNIYCNDRKLFDKMCLDLSHWISAAFEPANNLEYEFIQNNGRKKIICNYIPFHRYNYKVYLKEKINQEVKERLFHWINKYDGNMRMPSRVQQWLEGKKFWATNPYIYVENSSMLSMLLLFLGDRVSCVEEFVPRSEINIQSKETTCLV